MTVHDSKKGGPNGNNDGITPLSKINGTALTIADILKKDEKLLIGKSTYTKKCDSLGHCFVAKCKHYGMATNRQRYCTIYKDLNRKPAPPANKTSTATPGKPPVYNYSPYQRPAPQSYVSRPAYPVAGVAVAPRPAYGAPVTGSWYPMSAKWMSTANVLSTVMLAALFALSQ